MAGSIDQLIVNAPYEEPGRHWRYDRESRTFSPEAGRPAGYVVATPGSKSFDDPGLFVERPLVNRIRASRAGVAGGGISRRHGDDAAAAPALARSRGPVMITVANRAETAARVHYAFVHGKARIDELRDHAAQRRA